MDRRVALTLWMFLATLRTATANVPPAGTVCHSAGRVLADVNNCAVYWVCDHLLVPKYRACPRGQLFDAEALVCADEAAVACPNGYPPKCTLFSALVDGLVPDTDNCTVYWVCDSEQVAQYFECEVGLYYDVYNKQCNLSGLVDCVDGVRPLAP